MELSEYFPHRVGSTLAGWKMWEHILGFASEFARLLVRYESYVLHFFFMENLSNNMCLSSILNIGLSWRCRWILKWKRKEDEIEKNWDEEKVSITKCKLTAHCQCRNFTEHERKTYNKQNERWLMAVCLFRHLTASGNLAFRLNFPSDSVKTVPERLKAEFFAFKLMNNHKCAERHHYLYHLQKVFAQHNH